MQYSRSDGNIFLPEHDKCRAHEHPSSKILIGVAHAARRFWHPQAHWDKVPGVVKTSVGYTGGSTSNPDYKSVCRGDGHTEALKVTFDSSVLTYEEVMRQVLPDACEGRAKAQYMSAVWTQTNEQAKVAKQVAQSLGKEKVPILPARAWHDAEEYHQHYVEKQTRRRH